MYPGQDNISDLNIDNMIAVGFIELGQLPKAKRLLEKCYKEAVNAPGEKLLGSILHNYGYLYRKANDWSMALEYLNQAFEHFAVGSTNYLENLYQKARCLVDMKGFSSCAEVLEEGKRFSKER